MNGIRIYCLRGSSWQDWRATPPPYLMNGIHVGVLAAYAPYSGKILRR